MADIQLKVDPDIMKNIAGELQEIIRKIQNEYNRIKEIAEASNVHRAYTKNIEEEMQTILKRLAEHPTDLLKIAGLYSDNEEKIVELANMLPTNVIQ